MKQIYTRKDLAQITLKDDNKPTGGLSHAGETADEFVDAVYSGQLKSWDKSNCISANMLKTTLKECGLKI